MVVLVTTQLTDALEPHHLGHLGIGVHVVQVILALRHGCEQSAVREPLGHVKVFLVLGNGVGIHQHLVHTAVLVAQHVLHLGVRESCGQVDGPVAETQEECLSLFVTAVEPRIAQSGIHLMNIIERSPRTEVSPEFPFLEG